MARLTHGVALLLIVFAASAARSQPEKVVFYADINMSDCSITEPVNNVIDVYMFHVGMVSRTAVEFRAPKPDCWTGAVWVGDFVQPVFLTLGTSQGNWLAIAYGKCILPPILLGSIRYFTTGDAQPCCNYPVLPSTAWPTPIAVDCTFENIILIGAGSVTVNENETCLCNPPLAVERSTWGQVKALYR